MEIEWNTLSNLQFEQGSFKSHVIWEAYSKSNNESEYKEFFPSIVLSLPSIT